MLSTLSVASSFVALAAAAPLMKRAEVPEYAFNKVNLAETVFGNFTATSELPASVNLSCGAHKVETDFTASIKTNSTNITEVCGQTINVTNLDTGAFVLAQIVDECLTCDYGYLALSKTAFENVTKAENFTASYVFTSADAPARYVAPVAAPSSTYKAAKGNGHVDAPSSSSSSAHEVATPSTSWSSSHYHASSSKSDAEKPTTTSSYTHSPSSSSATWTPKSSSHSSSSSSSTWTPKHTSSSSSSTWTPEHTSSSSSSTWTPEHTSTSSSSSEKAEYTESSTSSSKTPEWTPSSSSKKAEWTPSSSSKTPEWTPSSSSKTPEYTPEYTPTTSSKKAEPTPQQQQQQSSGGGSYSGQATYFYQGGNPGACGNYNQDNAYIVALDYRMYSGGSHCGQQVRINSGGRSITATVADLCPSCASSGSLDLSVAAFQALGSLGQGVLPISWSFV